MFAYCLNNPTTNTDQTGLFATKIKMINIDGGETPAKGHGKKPWVPKKDKRHGSDGRQKTGARERNVAHPNGEEHSRIPKGNGRRNHRMEAISFDDLFILETPMYVEEPYILTTPTHNHEAYNWTHMPPHNSLNNLGSENILMIGVLGGALLVVVHCLEDMNLNGLRQ